MAASLLRVALAALCAEHASAAVIGIDFGARFIKVGIIQPGKGIELVLNEASKRKSSAAAGFNTAGERVYADDSFNLLGKLPGQQFVYSKLLLGKNVSHPHVLSFGELGYPYQFSTDPVTNAAIIEFEDDIRYRAEEAVAFVLSYCKQIAEKEAGSAVKDAVITVPAFFKETERAAMHNAAAIAGLNVLSLMHENTAFAFKYGFDKESEFTAGQDTNVLFYNMGAASYQVSLVSFSTSVGKKNKTTGSMAVRGVASDEMLGGRLFDQAVLDILADEFERQYPTVTPPIRESVRAMGKLRKESERIKDVLSANKEFKVGIEAVHEDRDLKLVIKRSDFEERCEHLFPRLLPPLDSVLAQANMSKADVHRVELIGGATRIHRVKEAVKDYFNFPTSASINADEAGALGATLYAAKLSTSFRLRDFHIVDYYPHAIRVKLGTDAEPTDRDDTEGGEESEEGGDEPAKRRGKDKLLFKAGTKFPHKKLITMSRTDDLEILLSYSDTGAPISSFNVSGVSAALARLTTDRRVPIGKPKVSVTFALSASGLLHVAKAEVALEMQEKYDDYEEVPMTEAEIAEAAAAKAAKEAAGETSVEEPQAKQGEGEEGAGAKGEEEGKGKEEERAEGEEEGEEGEGKPEGESESESAPASPPANATANASAVPMKKVLVEKERKRVHYSALKAEETILSAVRPLTPAQVEAAVARNTELLKAENVRKSNAAAKNDVESYIINTRDTLASDDTYSTISTEEERASISSELERAEDWLYEEGREMDAKAYAAKLKELKAMVAPVALRASEMVARPKVVSQAVEAINWTTSILETWAAERPEVTAAERDKVAAMCANFTSWLSKLEEAQAALQPTDPPAFLSTEVSAELAPIEKEVRRLIKKPKPKPAKPAKKSNATKADGAANGTGAEADEAGGAEAGADETETDGGDTEGGADGADAAVEAEAAGEGGAEGGETVKEEL